MLVVIHLDPEPLLQEYPMETTIPPAIPCSNQGIEAFCAVSCLAVVHALAHPSGLMPGGAI